MVLITNTQKPTHWQRCKSAVGLDVCSRGFRQKRELPRVTIILTSGTPILSIRRSPSRPHMARTQVWLDQLLLMR